MKFDAEKVTSVDWVTSPTLRHEDMPERIDVVIVNGDPNPNRPDLPHYGAGETMVKPMLAAVANAVFDATGVRPRRVPFANQPANRTELNRRAVRQVFRWSRADQLSEEPLAGSLLAITPGVRGIAETPFAG